jgi:hypothetical protein
MEMVEFKGEIIDVAENARKYGSLCERFGILPTNCVVMATNGRVKVVAVDEFYRMSHGRAVEFRGERTISSALADLAKPDGTVIYFLTGHGECELDSVSPSRGLSSLKRACDQRNYTAKSLNLCDEKAIPSDAAMVVSIGARNELLNFEIEILRNFVDNRNGKLLVALDGNFDIKLKEFLADYDIFVGTNVLVPDSARTATHSGDLVINRFSAHGINGKNIDLRLPVICGISHEVKCAPWADDDKFEIAELLQTGNGVVEQGVGEQSRGEYIIAAIAERRKFASSPAEANAGKVLVIGNSDFLANGKFTAFGNRVFWFGIGDYMLPVGNGLIFEDVDIGCHRLPMSKEDFNRIMGRIYLLPAVFLALAVLVAVRRR